MSDQQAPVGQLPQSNVLAEASPLSLAELLSLDPEKISEKQEMAIIQSLRDQRKRFEEAEKAGKKPNTVNKGEKKSAKAILQTMADVGDL